MVGLKIGAVIVSIVVVCGMAAPAPAGGGVEGKVNRIFQKLDVNRDDCLSPDEVQGHWMEKKFGRADADGNGAITRQELLEFKSGWHHKKAQIKSARIIEKLDADRDGRVSREEAGGHWMAHKFERVDVDSDGFLTYEEILAFKSGHKHRKGNKKAAGILARLDADQDGVISAEEAQNHWLGHKFERVDGNSDGVITLEELREFKKGWKHKKMR